MLHVEASQIEVFSINETSTLFALGDLALLCDNAARRNIIAVCMKWKVHVFVG